MPGRPSSALYLGPVLFLIGAVAGVAVQTMHDLDLFSGPWGLFIMTGYLCPWFVGIGLLLTVIGLWRSPAQGKTK